MNSRLIGFFSLVLIGFSSKAQTPLEELSAFQKKYPDENAIFTKMHEDCNIVIKDKKPIIISKVSEEIMILNEKGTVHNSRTVFSDSFKKISGLKASTLIPDTKKYKAKAVESFTEQSNMGEYSFYDDGRSTEITYPAVSMGVKTTLDYTETLDEAHFFGQSFLANYLPVDELRFSVTFPKSIALEYKLFNTENIQLEFSKEETKSSWKYTWVCKATPRIKTEDNAPGIRYYAPHIIVYIKEFKNGSVTEQYLNGTKGLYNWYSALIKKRNTTDSVYLKNVVDSIVQGSATNLEKAEKLFDWVENKIRYIAFEDGLGGFIPRDASNVCQKRFGDCKDMANLLNEMMKLAGLKSHLTWIGTRDLPYTYEQVPTVASDNHMILTFEDDQKKIYFLDATGKDHPFGFYTSMIQGKEALIGISDTEYRIEKIPEMDADKSIGYDTMLVQLDQNDVLQAKGVVDLNGYEKLSLLSLKSVDYDRRVKFLREYLQKGSNKFTIDTAFLNDFGKNKALKINYTGKIPDYVKRNKNELYINLQFQKGISKMMIDGESRKVPVEYDFKHKEINYVEFIIPDGYKVSYIPEAFDFKDEKYAAKITYEVKGNRIIMKREFLLNTLMLYPADFAGWNAYVKKMASSMNESIVLLKS